ncbi:MAG: TonB-dependent siderophore receptor, partial [Methylobacterium brachiatum]|nr:TonB-dependent siderophore receptor [Methylobacterium brachiatum]
TRLFGLNGEQRNQGIDLGLFGAPAEGFRVLGGLTLVDGRLTKTAAGLFNGHVAPGVPSMQANLGAEVDLPAWILPGVTLTGRVIYTASQYYDQANTQTIPDWTRLDLGIRYSFRANGTPLTARFNVENAAGARYWGSTAQSVLSYGTPRTFLASLTADF